MKRLMFRVVISVLVVCLLPYAACAAAKQMNEDVPVWTEATVKEYARQYIAQENLETLWGYYDMQIRRYMPMNTFQNFLTELAWKTGSFVEFGSYDSFEEPERETKTHVLHLCMEKQDLDLFFTHKNTTDDWEVMAVEFVLAQEQDSKQDLMVQGSAAASSAFAYQEMEVTVGSGEWKLGGTLTMPEGTEGDVPAIVLVQGSGASDRNETIMANKPFEDIAHALAEQGIASIRYDKRPYAYQQEFAKLQATSDMTVEQECVEDAILAGKLLQKTSGIDAKRVVLAGHSLGGMLAPRIVKQAGDVFSGMILISGTPKTLLQLIIEQNLDIVNAQPEAEKEKYMKQIVPLIDQADALEKMTADEAKATAILGINGYYFYEMQQYDEIAILKELALPTLILQGSDDFQVKPENGLDAYRKALGDAGFVTYKEYSGLNHLMMRFAGDTKDKGTVNEYATPAHVDEQVTQDMIDWIHAL